MKEYQRSEKGPTDSRSELGKHFESAEFSVFTSMYLYISTMKWLKASLIVQIFLAIYFLAMVWFPLGSWNDQPGKRFIDVAREGHVAAVLGFTLVMLLPVSLFLVAFWKRWFWLMWTGLFGYGVWLALQIQSWWIPWIFGEDSRALHNQIFLERTYKIFPSSPRHPAPDAMHFVLDLLLIASVLTIGVGLLRVRNQSEIRNIP